MSKDIEIVDGAYYSLLLNAIGCILNYLDLEFYFGKQ